MQGSETQKTNVVSLFNARDKAVDSASQAETGADDESFEATMERNKRNKDRIEKERLNANKSVLRSYRIKN